MGNKKLTNRDLASFFIQRAEKDMIISEVFCFFGFDCLARSSIDPRELDARIKAFEASDCSDAEALSAVIALIRQGKNTTEKQEKALLEDVKQYITEHLTEDISIEKIAADLHISYYYICHFFKQQTGMSLSTFRNQKRIEKAVYALAKTNEKVTAVALNCGFNNVSYFTELFKKITGISPTAFREKSKSAVFHSFYTYEDMLLACNMDSVDFLDTKLHEIPRSSMHTCSVHEPDEQFAFLHEAAIIEYEGVLYASWYHSPQHELRGHTPICGKRSFDGGKTWSELEIIVEDKAEKILFCPPVYGVCDGNLYMLINEMVAPDHIHALDLYMLNRATDRFELLWSRPIPFKLNTNVVTLPNGKPMLPGRVGELDGFPNTPAVLISDSGKIDGEWRLVKIAPNGNLPDGASLVHPEISVICGDDGTLYMFSRNDQRHVPFVYLSKDQGESWSAALAHDVSYINSKIYGGTLSDGRNFLIANTDKFDRSRLVIYFTAENTMHFEKYMVLFDSETAPLPGTAACHYPAAVESNGKLYIIATKNLSPPRGAVLFVVDLNTI